MRDIIFLQPVFKQMLWGGTRLRDEYGYDIPGDHTGEAWVVSAHSHGDCTVKEGPWAGKTLSWLWENQPQLFGSDGSGQFPLLVKIIDARDDLSIQVHPDEQYARAHENGASGKTECWYVLDCDPDSTIVIGHHAKDREELRRMAAEGRWSDLIRILPIKKGDFFQIEPGTVHAIRRNTAELRHHLPALRLRPAPGRKAQGASPGKEPGRDPLPAPGRPLGRQSDRDPRLHQAPSDHLPLLHRGQVGH